ncbi:sensor histidine kinase [Paenibacillus aurantius]|uniref:histidine kinase n=1 Tax=Paenibacillus aurantius TaxID=2918900 RepID=A0AA96LDT5_9BACL|nr:sensor histidine kinase [Paenibacillus aurantius]WNQ10295.1 sensor histidine kinase [Paenibacillus aurantius]
MKWWMALMGLLLWLTVCPGLAQAEPAVKAAAVLTEAELNEGRPLSLSGEWEFYWKALYTPGDLHNGGWKRTPGYLTAPSEWEGKTVNGEKLSNRGYGTYRLTVRLPEAYVGRTLALYMPPVATSYRLWIDGTEFASNGVPGTSADSMVPVNHPKVVPFTPRMENVELVIQVANFVQRKGGLWSPIKIGEAQMILFERTRNVVKEIFVSGCLAFMGLYHFGLYVFRRKERYPVYFAGICLSVFVRSLFVGETLGTYLFPGIPWQAATKLEYLGGIGALVSLVLFVHSQYPAESSKGFRTWMLFNGVLGGLTILVTPGSFYTEFLLIFQLLMAVPSLFYTLYVYLAAIRRRREGSLLNCIGFLFFAYAILTDMLFYRHMVSFGDIMPFGFMLFLFTQSLNLSGKFSRAFHHVEILSGELQDSNKDLERKVAARTAELQGINHKLEKANRELSRVAENRRIFFANVSHEVGTPLTSLKGYVKAMIDGIVKPGDLKYTELIYDKILFLERMVDDFMELARLETGQTRFRHTVEPAVTFFHWLYVKYETELTQKGLKLVWLEPAPGRLPIRDAMISADAIRLEQVFSNLLSNAAKFTPSGGEVRVRVGLDEERVGPPHFVVRITDTGEGVPDSERGRLFDRYYQGASGRQRGSSGGLGLGLAICREIISSHGGDIGVASPGEEGSTFYFTLPVHSFQQDLP